MFSGNILESPPVATDKTMYFMDSMIKEFNTMLKNHDYINFLPDVTYYQAVQSVIDECKTCGTVIESQKSNITYTEYKVVSDMTEKLTSAFERKEAMQSKQEKIKHNSLGLISFFYLNRLYKSWKKLTIQFNERQDGMNTKINEIKKELNKEKAKPKSEENSKKVEKAKKSNIIPEENTNYRKPKDQLKSMFPFLHNIYDPKKK